MKRRLIICLFLAALAVGGACSSVQPLKPRYYSKNIVIKADGSIWAEGDRLDFSKLKPELLRRMIFDETAIMLHFHESLTRDDFDRVTGKFKDAGYRNFDCTIYRD